MTARQAIAAAAARFGFSETPRLDAELLMAHAMGVERDRLLLARLDDPVPAAFAALVARRERHEPVAYITGRRGFWSIDLVVGPGALVPRNDSETLIEAAVARFAAGAATVLDLGTGPGTLLLALLDAWPAARGLGVDRSDAALAYARANAAALGLATRADFVRGDWSAAITGRFACIVTNPPYIGVDEELPAEVRDHEPAGALFAGFDGLDAYRRIVPALPDLLAPGGAAFIEIGATQATAVGALVAAVGLAAVVHRDLAGHPRCVVASA